MWPSPLYNEINNIFSLASSTDEIFLFYKIPEPYFSDKVQSKANEILSVLSSCGISPEDFNRKFMKSVVLYAELDEKIFDGVRIYAPTDSFIANASDSQRWFPKSRNNLLNTVQTLLEVPLGEFVSLFSAPFKEYNTAILIEKQI